MVCMKRKDYSRILLVNSSAYNFREVESQQAHKGTGHNQSVILCMYLFLIRCVTSTTFCENAVESQPAQKGTGCNQSAIFCMKLFLIWCVTGIAFCGKTLWIPYNSYKCHTRNTGTNKF